MVNQEAEALLHSLSDKGLPLPWNKANWKIIPNCLFSEESSHYNEYVVFFHVIERDMIQTQ